MDPKQQFERQLLDEFRRLSPEIVLTRIEQPEPPAPDVLADFRGRRIGIEITRHINQLEKKRESEEDRIVEMALDRYRESGGPAIGVSVFWVGHGSKSRSARKAIADALFMAVTQNVPPLGAWSELHFTSFPEPLASTVHGVRVDRLIEYADSEWRVPRSGWMAPVLPGHIRTAISAKESNWEQYQKYCDAVWLLIASEGLGPSSWCEVALEMRAERYQTHFDRVFFLSVFSRQVVELSVSIP